MDGKRQGLGYVRSKPPGWPDGFLDPCGAMPVGDVTRGQTRLPTLPG